MHTRLHVQPDFHYCMSLHRIGPENMKQAVLHVFPRARWFSFFYKEIQNENHIRFAPHTGSLKLDHHFQPVYARILGNITWTWCPPRNSVINTRVGVECRNILFSLAHLQGWNCQSHSAAISYKPWQHSSVLDCMDRPNLSPFSEPILAHIFRNLEDLAIKENKFLPTTDRLK